MKRYTETNAAKVLNRFLNSARKQEYSANRTLMHFAYTTKDGYMAWKSIRNRRKWKPLYRSSGSHWKKAR